MIHGGLPGVRAVLIGPGGSPLGGDPSVDDGGYFDHSRSLRVVSGDRYVIRTGDTRSFEDTSIETGGHLLQEEGSTLRTTGEK